MVREVTNQGAGQGPVQDFRKQFIEPMAMGSDIPTGDVLSTVGIGVAMTETAFAHADKTLPLVKAPVGVKVARIGA